jgi:predicted nuclease of predicted toxin-antitoxin system
MKIIVDENVSYGVALALREAGYDVIAIAESPTSGIVDEENFELVVNTSSVLITRDYHFTNPLRFPPDKTRGIIYIRRGNLTVVEEITLVQKFLSIHSHGDYSGKLVTLYKDSAKIR